MARGDNGNLRGDNGWVVPVLCSGEVRDAQDRGGIRGKHKMKSMKKPRIREATTSN